MQVGRVAPGELRDRGGGERAGLDPRGGQRGEHAPDLAPRIRPRGDDEAPALQPPAEQRDHVERRVVGPVEVLDHEQGGVGEGVAGGGEHVLAGAVRDRAGERAADLARHVAQRAERAGRDQRVARAPQRVAAAGDGGHERGLADARLAEHDDDAAGFDRRLQLRPLAISLKQFQRLASLTADQPHG